MSEYAVDLSPLTGELRIGAVSADGTRFTDKTEATGNILLAVSEWSEHHHPGEISVVKVGDYEMEIQVRRRTQDAATTDPIPPTPADADPHPNPDGRNPR